MRRKSCVYISEPPEISVVGGMEPEQQQQLGEEENSSRIYLATDGLTSNCTKSTYGNVFNHFIKTTVKNDNLKALWIQKT
jgi:hypothetical protein